MFSKETENINNSETSIDYFESYKMKFDKVWTDDQKVSHLSPVSWPLCHQLLVLM